MTQEIKDKEIDIQELAFPANVRRRPGMFLGSTEYPNVILRETIDNAVDESFGSVKCNRIFITTKVDMNATPKQYYLVADNGRGIPIIMDKDKGMTKTKMALTILNAGSKFNRNLSTVSTGQNGVGVSCTNATSENLVVCSKITSDNYNKSIPAVEELWYSKSSGEEAFYVLEFEKGIETKETAMTLNQIKSTYNVDFPSDMSTIVFFRPDPEIYTNTTAKYDTHNLKYLQAFHKIFYDKYVKIEIDGKEPADDYEKYEFEFKTKIDIPTTQVDSDGNQIHKQAIFYVTFENDKDMSVNEVTGSVNSLVVNRGLHLNFVRAAYRNAIKKYFNLQHDYIMAGLRMDVIIMAGEVDFSSQTKENCVKIDGIWEYEALPFLEKEFKKIFQSNDDYFQNHIARLNEYAASLMKISAINKVKSMVTVASDAGKKVRSKLPSNVKDCSSENRLDCELYIVEGKSAGGTILHTRNTINQAIIELRGVPMNSINADLDALLANSEMNAIISAIGVGVNEYFVESALRYGKIIIAADADPDGLRIASLILGMIARKITDLIRLGHVYVLDSPLYRQGDKYIYPSDDFEKELDKSKPFKRFKGLGEISEDESKEVLTGDKRRLIKITMDNVDEAVELLSSSWARKELMVRKNIVVDKYNVGIQ